MAGISKRVSGSWVSGDYGIMKTATDTITTLPADLYADGNNATVGLVGNMYQASGVSPTTPIQPQECGERTGNLLDYTTVESTTNATATQISGGISVSGRYYVRFRTVGFTVGNAYTMSWKADTISGTSAPAWRFHYADNTYSSMQSSGGALVAEKEVSELFLYVSTSASCVVEFTEIMLNTGSQPLPYEPFGVKIPILSANTTTPVYLGEVQTTRRIKKLVLTGEETYTADEPYSRFITAFPNAKIEGLRLTQVFCTHFISVYDGRPISEVPNNSIYSSDVTVDRFFIKTTDYTSAADFKDYLRQQYANGTPVTVWYVLATPETAVVNEPLRKIGDYADTLSNVSIPVTAGGDTISVGTTLQPSEVTVNYKGWHPAIVHERTNGAWT